MTIERMIELLEIEHECMRRGAHNKCDRDCANCELVQDDQELDEMYTGVIALLKEQEAVEPILEQDSMVCGACGHEVIWQKMLGDGVWLDEELDYCPHCGQAVKWE